jgi:molecular chaperone GrpE
MDTKQKQEKEKTKKSKDKLSSKQEIENLTSELAEAKDKYLRLFAEFENYKKRITRERLDLLKTAAQSTIEAIIPVLDDFDRAKKSAEDENSPEQLSEGVLMVYNKLYTILANKGLTAMESNGLDFDPEIHEAITEIPAPSEDMKGKVIDTIEKGYLLNDKIIRFAKVVVGK